MNILVPDSWLKEYLETKATPKQLGEYMSLCGPSVERVHTEGKETIYDIEVTSNRPDTMSIFGIAREAAAILPRFGIAAKLKNDPYRLKSSTLKGPKQLSITTDFSLNPRWTSVVIDGVTVRESPKWLKEKLEQTGVRSLNNVINIPNGIHTIKAKATDSQGKIAEQERHVGINVPYSESTPTPTP